MSKKDITGMVRVYLKGGDRCAGSCEDGGAGAD